MLVACSSCFRSGRNPLSRWRSIVHRLVINLYSNSVSASGCTVLPCALDMHIKGTLGRADNVQCSKPTHGILLRSKSKVAQHVLEARSLPEAQHALLFHLYVLHPDARRGSSWPWPLRRHEARRDSRLHGVPHRLIARSQHLPSLRARPTQLWNSAVHGFRHSAHGVGVLLALLLQPAIREPFVECLGVKHLDSSCFSFL